MLRVHIRFFVQQSSSVLRGLCEGSHHFSKAPDLKTKHTDGFQAQHPLTQLCGVCMCVQDGHFVPNLTIGAPVVQSLRKHSDAFFDCHLMVTSPQQWVQVGPAPTTTAV